MLLLKGAWPSASALVDRYHGRGGECHFRVTEQPRARTHGFTGVAAHSPLVEKGNEIQRCWRLYEFCRASNGPDLLIRHVSSIWYS
jgi:hypothetical protein